MIFLQWLWEEEEGLYATLAAKLIKECQSEGAEHIYLVLVT
jgi:methylmalonyl-CoA mutase cobalamin-binding subunit